jgi:hypothetical protein
VDEAFHPFDRILAGMAPTDAAFQDDDAGFRTYVERFAIEAPVELDVSRDGDGVLRIGSTPPLYYVDTSLRPSYHYLRFRAELTTDGDDG